jgi:hypothetical protein
MNERGHYTVSGDCGSEKVLVEIDPSVVAGQHQDAERSLMEHASEGSRRGAEQVGGG